MDEYTESNRVFWNARTAINANRYDVAGFKAGKSMLTPLVREELGDVSGKSLLHLQCGLGLDTLSWARLGARVTGVDLSEDAIALAHSLSQETGLEARFLCTDIYQLPQMLEDTFDIVFTSGGVLYWLSDLGRWAEIIAHFLKPGGVFYLQEIHPFINIFDDDDAVTDLRPRYPYFHTAEPLRIEELMPYSDPAANQRGISHNWSYSFSDVLNPLITAGLRLEFLHEFPHGGDPGEDEKWRRKDPTHCIPLTFSLQARKE